MQTSGNSSILRSLAIAFGDGLAFAAGVKLTQNAARQVGAPPRPDSGDLPQRLAAIEQTVKRLELSPPAASAGTEQKGPGMDKKVLEAIVNALEARLKEHGGQMERRIADLDAKMAIELKALDEQDQAIAQKVTGDLNALEGQVISLNREFSEAVAKIVAAQVATQVEARAAAAELALESRMGMAVEAAVERRVGEIVNGRLEPMERQLRGEIAEKDREIGELRRQLAEADTNLLDIVAGIGQICRQAAERMGHSTPPAPTPIPMPPPAAETAHEERPAPVEMPAPHEAADPPVPGFTQLQKPNRLWRVPLVSSLVLLATGGLLLAHYL
jgi:hypothetical protein